MSTVQLETIAHRISGAPTTGASTRSAPVYDPSTGKVQRQRADPGPDELLQLRRLEAVVFGDHHIHGPEGVKFYTRAKVVTTRWPGEAQDSSHHRGHMHFPTAV